MKPGKHRKALQPWKGIQLVLRFLHYRARGGVLARKDQRIQPIMSSRPLALQKKNKKRPPFQRGPQPHPRPLLVSGTQRPPIIKNFQPRFIWPPPLPLLQCPQFAAPPLSAPITAPLPIPPPTPGQLPQGYSPPKPTAQIPPFMSFGKPRTEKKYQKPLWMVNNKTQHFKYDQAFQAYAATFRLEDFPTLIKSAFSIVTDKIEKDHQSTSLCFVTIVQLWFKIVAFIRQQQPKTTAQ